MKSILVMRRGLLGDTVVAVPALRLLRNAFPDANITLVSEVHGKTGICWGQEVLEGSGIVDAVVGFSGYNTPRIHSKSIALISLIRKVGLRRWDVGIALDFPHNITWEPTVLRILGSRIILRPEPAPRHERGADGLLSHQTSLMEQLIVVLRPLGVISPLQLDMQSDIALKEEERLNLEGWLHLNGASLLPRPWIAVAPWSNMPAKQYPTKGFEKAVSLLLRRRGGSLFVLGGRENIDDANRFTREIGCGIPVAGALSVRQTVALLERCDIFLGNDSGAMHMAASAGLPCVAIFSGRDSPGLWDPQGDGHIVLRRRLPCEGCMLKECPADIGNRCIRDIGVDEVVAAAELVLDRKRVKLSEDLRGLI